jgi:hypothetical protein
MIPWNPSKELVHLVHYTPAAQKINQTTETKEARNSSTTNIFSVPNKLNLRIMMINCRSIRDKKSEFAALVNYAKPDIIIGTESWLKGIKPGKPLTESAEIFPENFSVQKRQRYTRKRHVYNSTLRTSINRTT